MHRVAVVGLRLGGLASPPLPALGAVRWSSAISQPVFHQGDQWERRRDVAMVDENGSHTYGQVSHANICSMFSLLTKFLFILQVSVRSRMVANALQAELGTNPEKSKKISFLCGNNVKFVDAMWGIWR